MRLVRNMRAKIGRLGGLLCLFGLAFIIATPRWAAGGSYEFDDFGRPIEVLYDDATGIENPRISNP